MPSQVPGLDQRQNRRIEDAPGPLAPREDRGENREELRLQHDGLPDGGRIDPGQRSAFPPGGQQVFEAAGFFDRFLGRRERSLPLESDRHVEHRAHDEHAPLGKIHGRRRRRHAVSGSGQRHRHRHRHRAGGDPRRNVQHQL
jgi:hypothetical protein